VSDNEVRAVFNGNAKDTSLSEVKVFFSTQDLEKPELIVAQCEEHKGQTALMLSVAPNFVKK
jgi:hypothetical protein